MINRILFTSVLIFLIPFAAIAQNLDSRSGDELALSELYQYTNGDNWHDNTGWNSGNVSLSDNPVGITIEVINGELRVTEVDMQKVTYDGGWTTGNNLTGTLPESIGNLTRVEKFNVKQNFLTGGIPESIGNMVSLVRLSLAGQSCEIDLDHPTEWYESRHDRCPGVSSSSKRFAHTNEFTGPIPATIGNLSELELLEIRAQRLTGTLPAEIGNLTKLRGIFLNDQFGSNALGGEIPSGWGGLVNLRWLSLTNYYGDGRYTGQVPSDWENWVAIRNVQMSRNNLTGSVPIFPNAVDMHYVNWSRNSFTGEFPTDYFNGKNSRMSKFSLQFNNLTGELPQTIPSITQPEPDSYYRYMGDFTIAQNDFTGALPQWVRDMRRVIIFDINHNGFTGDFPATIASSNRLRHLRLWDNNFSGELPEVDWRSSSLRTIRIQNNQFQGHIPEEWANLNELENFSELDIRRNHFTEEDFAHLLDAFDDEVTFRYGDQSSSDDISDNDGDNDHDDNQNDGNYDNSGHEGEFTDNEVTTEMGQNYPNPFNPTTQIRFALAETQEVSLSVYNLAGQRVSTLASGTLNAGTHQVTFNAEGLSSGVYFYRLITSSEIITRKMLLIK